MTNTKKSLLASGISLLVSCALLAGTTFAWFTDSVTNAGNKIQAGKLEVSLNGDSTEKLFGSDNTFLWEPGRSQKAAVSLANEGTLWLKYTVAVDQAAAVDTIEPQADVTKVLDVYKVAKAESDVTAADLTAENKLGTMAELMTKGGTLQADGILAPAGKTGTVDQIVYDDSDVFTLVVKMQETAGNEYQGAGVTFDVVVKATQYTYEEDGFGSSDYDAGATYAVSSEKELREALNVDGAVVALAQDITLSEPLTVPEGVSVSLNLNGKDMRGTNPGPLLENHGTMILTGDESSHVYTTDVQVQGRHAVVNYGTLTIDGGSYGSNASRGNAIRNFGVATIKNGIFTACDNYTNGGYAYAIASGSTAYPDAVMTVENAVVSGKMNGVLACDGGKMIVKGGSYTLGTGEETNLFYMAYTSGNGSLELIGGTYTRNVKNDHGFLNASSAGSSIVVKGGTYADLVNNHFRIIGEGDVTLGGGMDWDSVVYG